MKKLIVFLIFVSPLFSETEITFVAPGKLIVSAPKGAKVQPKPENNDTNEFPQVQFNDFDDCIILENEEVKKQKSG